MTATAELLVEVRCDEIPSAYLPAAVGELRDRVVGELRQAGLEPEEIRTAHTCRRLVLQVQGLERKAAGAEQEIRGPSVRLAFDQKGEPTPRLLRFLERHGGTVDELERVERARSTGLVLRRQGPDRATREVIGEILEKVVPTLSWPETMRWQAGGGEWVRPLRGLLALFDGEVVPCSLLGVEAGSTSVGHPVLSQRPFKIRDGADYFRKLSARGIEPDFALRRRALSEALHNRARELGGELVEDERLLDRAAGSCEIAGAIDGRIELGYLSLPRELVIACLRQRQSAFAVASGGSLLPFFLAMMDRPNDPDGRVQAGHQWAVSAQLEDVRFHWQRDREVPLAERARRLAELPVATGVGSHGEQAERLVALCELLCQELDWKREVDQASEAARLLKADVGSALVRAFPRQQGVIGGLLAKEEGYPETIWRALYEQRQIPGSGGERLGGRVGSLVGLADRIDTLVAHFGVDDNPEPATLEECRSLAEGAVRIAMDEGLKLDLDLVAARSARLYGDSLARSAEEILGSLRPFLDDSVRRVLGAAGFRRDEIDAVLAAGETSLLADVRARVEAVHRLRQDPSFPTVVQAARRVIDILKDSPEVQLDPELLVEEAEKDLFVVYQKLRGEIDRSVARGEYEAWLRRVVDLARAVERFLAEVLVRDENERRRQNRFALLQAVHRVLLRRIRVAELSGDPAPEATGRIE